MQNIPDYKTKLYQIAAKQNLLVQTAKGTLEVPVRVPMNGEYVVVDACNAVLGLENFGAKASSINDPELTDDDRAYLADDLAFDIATELFDIFGSDFANVTNTGRGLHFYKHAYTIGHKDCILGKIAFGGQNNTCLIMITGKGCYFADDNWEHNFYSFLKSAKRAKLTRIDYAHDDFDGAYSSPDIANTADSQGMFALTNRLPQVQHLGDWKRHEGRGRTLQVGKRENGKLYRGYEKGKEQGDKESSWFRSEVEFGSSGRLLDLEMLISPTQYFAGAYPYCLELVEHAKGTNYEGSLRVPVVQKETEISLEKSISIWKHQAGRYIAVYRDLYKVENEHGDLVPDDKLILDMLMTDKKDYYPPRLKLIEKFIKNPPTYAPWADNKSLALSE